MRSSYSLVDIYREIDAMLSSPPMWLAVVLGGVLIPLLCWWVVGARRHRDPFLLPATILAVEALAVGLGTAVSGHGVFNWYLTVGILACVALRSRWMRASAPTGARPEV